MNEDEKFVSDDPRANNPRYGDHKQIKQLLKLEGWIYKMMDIRNDNKIVMESRFLPEITKASLWIQLNAKNFCLYDFVDEFLEEAGIEVSYSSNFIRFNRIKRKELENSEKSIHIEGVYGLVAIGWGIAKIGILKDDQIEILGNYKKSIQNSNLFMSQFTQLELEKWTSLIRKLNYKKICQYANDLLKLKLNQLNAIIIGLKRYIRKEEIDLNWFDPPIQEKISDIIEIENASILGMDLLVRYLRKKNLKKKT